MKGLRSKGPLTVSWVFCLFFEGLQKCTGILDFNLYGTKMFVQCLFLAHLAQSAKVSFCDTGLSVVRRPSVRACVRPCVRACVNNLFKHLLL